MYADDTTLYCSIDKLSANNINIVINEHLDKVNVLMNSNQLVLNSKKKYMLFQEHNETLPYLKLSINGRTIDQVTRFKFSWSSFQFTTYMAYTH